jgi:lysophospholipase L1-like esterase
MTKKIDILLIGSSIIKKWTNIKKYFPNKKIKNIGINGLITEKILSNFTYYIKKIIKYRPCYIIYYCGGNDVMKNINGSKIYNNIKSFYYKIKEKLNKSDYFPRIIIISIIKSPKKKRYIHQIKKINNINQKLYLFCKKKNISYVNINKELKNKIYYTEDMNHLNNNGYNQINKKINKKINKIIK